MAIDHFSCKALIGPALDVESHPHGFPTTEHGVVMYAHAVGLRVSRDMVRRWCELAQANPGQSVDCMEWRGEGEARRPVAAFRLTYVLAKGVI